MKLDHRRINIMDYLLDYRGLNAKHMTAFIYLTRDYTTSNLKQVQREIKTLVDVDYITFFKYTENLVDEAGVYKTQKVSMYQLTQKGYEYMLRYYNVLPGQQGSGFINDDDFVRGDIPYDTYTPPTKLVDHHLMGIEVFLQLTLNMPVPHRINLYASKPLTGKQRLRPDAEVLVNGRVYFLEFDRNTENHEKLIEKFELYKTYFETLSGDELNKLGKIVFVMEDEQGAKRRWNNVLAAFLKVIGSYHNHVQLVMCSLASISRLFLAETDHADIKKDMINYVKKPIRVWHTRHGVLYITHDVKIALYTFQHQYDSSLFLALHYMDQHTKKENLEHSGTATIVATNRYEAPLLNLQHYDVPEDYVKLYNKFASYIKTILIYPWFKTQADNDDEDYS